MQPTMNDFCVTILKLDRHIGFVGVEHREGNMIGHKHRKGIVPFISPQTKAFVLSSFIHMGTRATLDQKLGATVYAFAMYKRVKKMTIHRTMR